MASAPMASRDQASVRGASQASVGWRTLHPPSRCVPAGAPVAIVAQLVGVQAGMAGSRRLVLPRAIKAAKAGSAPSATKRCSRGKFMPSMPIWSKRLGRAAPAIVFP